MADVPHGVLAVLQAGRADLVLAHLVLRLYVSRPFYHSPELKNSSKQQKTIKIYNYEVIDSLTLEKMLKSKRRLFFIDN